ncbi:hypothetical protein DP73_02990 [Desulfosporosinus sp. HMP52]|uniref:TolC family protein n=1 Tax=Desulfosporosinus sp. HMP52 TaxID=1487923 RepID=UPI00051FC188|nr:TolC family protein [Desulfosporosinus sp. HMP52]KGK91561.1 hypothetical protein DP73_02990 [Desulfosporosinus sp. HMP52]
MKKLLGMSLFSAMLLLGQPIMAYAGSTVSTMVNFGDINGIIAEKNIDVQINKNSSLKDKVDLSNIKRTIKDLEDDLEDIDEQRDANPALALALGSQKHILLDALREAERGAVDKPTIEAIIDLKNEISEVGIVRSAEGIFIGYNQLNSGISSLSSNIETLQKKLTAMELQESLGMIPQNNVNNLKTSLVNLQTQLESLKFQQGSLERRFKNLLNDQESLYTIGTIPSESADFIIKDKDADLEKALENSYTIKLQKLQIITLESALDRAKKDTSSSSKQYKKANYDLTNGNLKLTQLEDGVRLSYNSMIDNISNLQSELQLAQKTLQDKKVTLYEAKLKMVLGMISQLELDETNKEYQVQENAVKTKQIDLFNAKCNYEWFLKGVTSTN